MTYQWKPGEHPVLEEEAAWERVVEDVLGADAELLAVSRWCGDSRAYRHGPEVARIRSLNAVLPVGVPRFGEELRVLEALGREGRVIKRDGWEALVLPYIEGAPLNRVTAGMSLVQRAKVMAGVVPELRTLHRHGIAHLDLRQDNIIVGRDGRPKIIDFDRARFASRGEALAADWLGIGAWDGPRNPYWQLGLYTLLPRSQGLVQRVRAQLRRQRSPVLGEVTDDDLAKLAQAWRIAQQSSANAPGQAVAYYAYTYKGTHFIGERPWYLRWEAIRRRVNFTGKRLLELGCNMGMLSSFALIHGAASAQAVDHDPEILQAARLVADAHQTDPKFERVDLVGDPNWDSRLAGSDIVVAMSLLHWLPDKERLLTFLSTHPEVIYEGHDSLDEEIKRLHSIGFDDVALIAENERGRHVIHGRRTQ